MMRNSIDLALIGNCRAGALIDPSAEIEWWCVPGFDGDPVFCSLLREHEKGEGFGYAAIELVDQVRTEQEYLPDSPVLLTRLYDAHGGAAEITDFAPRFRTSGIIFAPLMLIRRIQRIAGAPQIRLRVRPACEYGSRPCAVSVERGRIRYSARDWAMHLSTNAPHDSILEETPFLLKDSVAMVFASGNDIRDTADTPVAHYHYETLSYWQAWVARLRLPEHWQREVIRAAITLKLNTYEETGAIIAAMTTSIPEANSTPRTWDYRYCWLRDAYYVINALNRLGSTRTMENYVEYLARLVAGHTGGPMQPVYGINCRQRLDEQEIDSLPGYRGMGPVRIGNQAYEQAQHDVYGSAIMAVAHMFFDHRLIRRADAGLFHKLEQMGEMARASYNQPDAGIWELRGSSKPHTFSSVMCWAACDRLARIAAVLGLTDRCAYWRACADAMHAEICSRAWNHERQVFSSVFDSHSLDACMLLLHDIGFIAADDPRFSVTVEAIGRELKRGDYIYRYLDADDFGVPENAFIACTFWYVSALGAVGRTEEAREIFTNLLSKCNRLGLLSEHIDPRTGEQWGNFVQTYSMAGLIDCAIRLSNPREQVVREPRVTGLQEERSSLYFAGS